MADQQPTQQKSQQQPTGNSIIDERATVQRCAEDYAANAPARAEFARQLAARRRP